MPELQQPDSAVLDHAAGEPAPGTAGAGRTACHPTHAASPGEAVDWTTAYERMVPRLPFLAAAAGTTLCGFSTCVDAYIRLEQAEPLLAADPATPAGALARRILERAWRQCAWRRLHGH